MWRICLGAALAATVCASTGAHARAVHMTSVNGTFTDRGFLTGFQGVSPMPPGLPQEAVFHGISKVVGATMHGEVSYTLWGAPTTGGNFEFHTVEVFKGFVAGCGSGTMTYDVTGTSTPQGPTNPTEQHLQATWSVEPGKGSGDLTKVVSGGGQLNGTVEPTTANSGSIRGVIRCTR